MTGRPLVIIGAGGFGREVHDVMEEINAKAVLTGRRAYRFLGFVDDGQPDAELLASRGPFLGGLTELMHLPTDTEYVIAIGDGRVRQGIDQQVTKLGLNPATLVHPAATLGQHGIVIGPGSVICSHASLTTNIRLSRHVHLNLNVTVGHDAVIGDYVTVNPGATISGNVTLENECNIGTGAAVIQGVTVGRGAIIGAGAAVVNDIPPGVTAVGVPARAL
jgi:sugar O-acyltransferase (sialic acid O-acetyltransferase NeuD family)